jgi:hypothetical protein
MSYVKIELTAIYSLLLALVTAIKTINKVQTAPPEPRRATAAYGRTRPAETSASGIRLGNVGNAGFPSRARAESPIVVAQSQGMANQDSPPKIYPGNA